LLGPSGGLELDRAWALHTVDGKWVNGKRTPLVHAVRAEYADDLSSVTLSVPSDRRPLPTRRFAFPTGHEEASEWFSVFLEQQILVRYSADGFPDDPIANGPTIISTASLREVCTWFPEIPLEQMRERFRATLEVDIDPQEAAKGAELPPFWEDRLFGENARSVARFSIGEVQFEGSNPCARCPVPPRNPRTGEVLVGFQKRFTEMRDKTLPEWAARERFDHFYCLSTNTRVDTTQVGAKLRIGDPVLLGA
jgi:uncharacterized protein YcbX